MPHKLRVGECCPQPRRASAGRRVQLCLCSLGIWPELPRAATPAAQRQESGWPQRSFSAGGADSSGDAAFSPRLFFQRCHRGPGRIPDPPLSPRAVSAPGWGLSPPARAGAPEGKWETAGQMGGSGDCAEREVVEPVVGVAGGRGDQEREKPGPERRGETGAGARAGAGVGVGRLRVGVGNAEGLGWGRVCRCGGRISRTVCRRRRGNAFPAPVGAAVPGEPCRDAERRDPADSTALGPPRGVGGRREPRVSGGRVSGLAPEVRSRAAPSAGRAAQQR